jgi:hypothetical protein
MAVATQEVGQILDPTSLLPRAGLEARQTSSDRQATSLDGTGRSRDDSLVGRCLDDDAEAIPTRHIPRDQL